jgi:hypothetical protein
MTLHLQCCALKSGRFGKYIRQLHSTHQIAMYGCVRILIKKSIVMHMPLIRFQFWTFSCALKLISSRLCSDHGWHTRSGSKHKISGLSPQSSCTVYKEYHSVCPLVGHGTLPPPLSPASVPRTKGGAHSPAGRGWGVPIPTTGEKA